MLHEGRGGRQGELRPSSRICKPLWRLVARLPVVKASMGMVDFYEATTVDAACLEHLCKP